ncbi:MAG: PAS domain S-box protein [Kiritimatiellaceae bacterium]|nr:PAS domain S-box protein [Kiritimatiellaceae bacterium]
MKQNGQPRLSLSATEGLKAASVFILIFILLTAGFITAGCFYYKNYKQTHQAEVERQLLAIADLKVGELTQYRKERLGDAAIFHNNPVFSQLVRRFLDQPEDTEANRLLRIWLKKNQEHYQYDQVFLLDAQGAARMAVPGLTTPVPSLILARLPELFQSGQVVFQDFYRPAPGSPVYLSLLVPIRDEENSRPLGVLVLQINPATYLYPFIQSWPIPSSTAETLLVRREGNEVVFLNELRFRKNTALAMRGSLTLTNVPAVKAALGQSGIVEGDDYRGEPVVAAIRAIPDSPWFMVARQDKTEVVAPLQAQLWQVVGMVGVLLFGSAAAIGLVWRQQRVRFYQEKAKTAEALRETNDYLENLIDYANAPIIVWNADGRITRFNRAFESIAGMNAEQVLGQGLEVLFAEDQKARAMGIVKRASEGERFDLVEVPIRHADGSQRTVLWNSAPIFGPDGKRQMATIAQGQDITNRKEAQEKLIEAMDELRVSNRDLEQFAYIASHDLQEPLRMVSNYVQLIERRYKDKLDQDARDFIYYASDGAMRMQKLIDSLLEYSRLHSRQKPFAPVDLNRILQRVLRDFEKRIFESGAHVTAGPLPGVSGDEVQLGQVFQNLISNALKFKGDKSPEVQISADEFPDHWKITVRDNGIGIAPEYQERIFKIFQRLHSRADYPGTGIGLAVFKRIIERHGGKSGVESEAGKGSSFWFTLPKKGKN